MQFCTFVEQNKFFKIQQIKSKLMQVFKLVFFDFFCM
jgi:hypothetical protein